MRARFFQKVHTKTQSQKKDLLVIFVLQETKNSNLVTQTLLKTTSNAIFNMKKVDLGGH